MRECSDQLKRLICIKGKSIKIIKFCEINNYKTCFHGRFNKLSWAKIKKIEQSAAFCLNGQLKSCSFCVRVDLTIK